MNGFGVETGCEHHMFVNMHQREIEKQIYLNFLNCMIFWGFKGIGSRDYMLTSMFIGKVLIDRD